jgi:23S rRNA (adenine2030-N6)-methyltransferase
VKYRHAFHAGNFADVHKHVTLLALVRALQRKDKGFLYLDTHAGAGLYDLNGGDSHHGAEAKHGIGVLLGQNATQTPSAGAGAGAGAEVRDYVDAVAAVRTQHPGAYPGSPLLVARALRSQDRGVCFERVPSECRALERALGGLRSMRVECGDGVAGLTAHLPPLERRALALIDPPYEEDAEQRTALAAVSTVLARLANAIVLLWYPVKDRRDLTPWLAQAEKIAAPVLRTELWLYPCDSRVALNGSGLLIVNPPYLFDERMRDWLPELGTALNAQRGGTSQAWLVTPKAAERA